MNDLVTIIGNKTDIIDITRILGEVSLEKLEDDRHEYDFRRIFVSNKNVMGKKIKNLPLNKN